MPTFKTLERAERYAAKHCFTPIIKERYHKTNDEFLGFTVKDKWDLENGIN